MPTDRKPQLQTKEPAQEKLNKFLIENEILLGTERPNIEFTGSGQMVVSSPRIFAVFKKDVAKPVSNTAN